MRVAGMDPRFVTKTMHAYLDYPVAASLVALPFILGLGTSHPVAKWLAVITGVAAFVLTFFTDHKTGVVLVIAPFALGFAGLDAWYYWANGAAVLLVVSLHKPEAVQVRMASA